ncbi:MAG: DNA polymerase III subunit gamma/tau, partial [Clostridia bacterium]|nr:DNA polymerase III subunit gamma/tau [Clostridia bacterium]
MATNLALYRKYRPVTFGQVVGQSSITTALSGQVASGKVSHAYLFTGTRGTGKTTCARIFARAICCQNPQNGEPCNECTACRAALGGSALDITEIDAASNNGVDNIRELRSEAIYAPTELKYRVYIIDEVHMLSQGASNALLKILEEPPAHAVFILATTDPQKVLPTIHSRCQRYDFRRIPAEIMAAALESIARQDGFVLDHDAADILAAMGDGSMRDSISLLDRAKGATFHVTADSVTEALGLATEREIINIFSAVLQGDAAGAIAAFTDCYMTGRDLITIFDNLLSLLRDIYLYKATGQSDYLLSRWRTRVPELAQHCTAQRLEASIEAINYFLSRTTRTSAKRLDGEMCLIKMSLPDWGVPQAMPAAAQPVSPAQPVQNAAPAAPAPVKAQPAPQPVQAAPMDDDGLPPWDDSDIPPVDAVPVFDMPAMDEPVPQPPVYEQPVYEQPVRRSESKPAAAPVRMEYEAPAPQAPSGSYETLRRNLEGKISSAVRVYLGMAQTREQDGGIYIEVPEEGLIFIGKPDVLALIDEAGKAAGYAFAKVGKQLPKQKEDPLETIRARAHDLGVPVKVR